MKTVIEMAREAGFEYYDQFPEDYKNKLKRFATLVREDEREKVKALLLDKEAYDLGYDDGQRDEREKFNAVGEVKDGSFGGFVWNEGITSDEAPDGAVLYVRGEKLKQQESKPDYMVDAPVMHPFKSGGRYDF